MAKQLNVNLAFTADTTQAKKNIEDLQTSLNAISSIKPSFGMSLTKDMQEAVSSAKTLQNHLNNAFNTKTGNLDLSKLNASLKSAGTDLATLSSGLLKAGLSGEQAFMNIQRSVATASVQIKQANGLLANFWTTLKNTARWQFSSSMLHGFMGAMQSAYSYAKDLDKSLNNIRIVTGYNIDTMTAFAEQANKAAKALSTTTTSYTDAALIFYQQGLKGDAVTERADTVIKMANVTGEVAADVSDYMTAVWNNFYDGSKSLEYYADVMTALGAATASSTDEIAAGLEKFAAVADTVGLSYEYATAALATVTAETRQSADVVGTAFKTLFARIQDLELGETLDDGTTLGSYSQALAKVGISIMDTSGEMKKMDVILTEMAGKWDDLSAAQQTALAQSVAGVRQYTQLIALMDNWGSMEKNLDVAFDAEGSLQEQSDIYEESWAAASKRVKASLEGLYNDLIPKDFIISMTDAFADIITAVDAVVNGFGGLQGILLLVANIALTKMGPALTNGINQGVEKLGEFIAKAPGMLNIFSGFKSASTGSSELVNNISKINNGLSSASAQSEHFAQNFAKGASESLKMSQGMNAEAIKKAANEQIVLSNSFEGYLLDTGKVYNLQGLIEQNASKLTQAERERLSIMQQQVLAAAAQKAEAQATLDIAELTLDRTKNKVDGDVFQNKGYFESGSNKAQTGVTALPGSEMVGEVSGIMSSMETSFASTNEYAKNLLTTWTEFISSLSGANLAVNEINGHLAITSTSTDGIGIGAREAATAFGNVVEVNDNINKILKQQGVSYQDQKKAILGVVSAAQKQGKISKEVADGYRNALKHTRSFESMSKKITSAMSQTQAKAEQVAQAFGNSKSHLTTMENGVHAVSNAQSTLSDQERQFNQELEQTLNYLNQIGTKASTLGGMITTGLQGFTTVAMGINSISNAVSTLSDESAGFGQKMVSLAMALTMGFNAAKTVISGVGGSLSILAAKKQGLVAANAALQASETKSAVATQLSAAAQALSTGATEADTAATVANTLQTLLGVKAETAEAMASQFVAIAKEQGAAAAIKQTVANIGLAASEYMVLWPLLLIVAAITTLVAAFAIWDACTVSAAEKTERLTENVENMKDAASEAREEAEGLRDAFDKYQNVKTTLENCTVGTTEWKEAMEGVKTAIDGILEAYPGLAAVADILKWDEGTQSYILDEDKVNNYIKGQENASNAMSYGAQMAEGMLLDDRASYSAANFKNEIALSNYANNYSNNGLNDLNVSNLTGDETSDREIIRNAIKNDAIAGNLVDMYQFAAQDGYGNYLVNDDGTLQLKDPEGYQAALDSYVDSQMEANSELINSLFSIAETYREINGQAQTIYENATKAKVSEKFAGQGLTEAEMNAAAAATQKDYDAIFTDLYGEDGTGDAAMARAFAKGDSDWDSLSEEGKAILTRYEEAVGHAISWSDNLVQGTDASRTFHINGQDKGLTPEEIATTIAAYEALGGDEATENQQASMDIVSNALASANATGDSLITAITNGGDKEAMSNFLGQFTQSELETLMAGIDSSTGEIDADTLSQLGLTPEQLSQVGEVFGLSAEQIGLALVDAGNTIQSFTEEQQAILDATAVDISNATIGQQKAFAEARGNIGEYLTKESDGAISESVLGDIESENADNVEGLTKFYEGLGNINLTAEDASEQIAALAEQYDIEGVAVENLMTSVEGLDQVYNIATKNISDQAASLKEIVGEGLETGDVISAEDLQVLADAGINVDQYFTQMADGTYTLIGKADEFNAAVNRITFEGLKRQWQDFSTAEAQVLENYTDSAYAGKIRDTSSFQAGDASGNQGRVLSGYGADQLGRARLDYVNSFEAGTFDFSNEQNQLLADYTANPEMELTVEQLQMIADMIDVVNQKSADLEAQMFSTATSVAELNQIASEMGTYSLNAYGEGLINLASKYDNCTQEIEELQAAMLSGDEAMIKTKIDALELAAAIGEMSEKYGLDAEDVETHAKLLRESAEGYELTAEQAANMAVANRRMNKGVKTLNENWKDWSKILKSSNRGTIDYADTLNDAHEALADLVGAVDAAAIPLDFLDASTESGAQHLEWMEKAAQGDAEAINQLGVALAAAQVEMMEFNEAAAQMAIDGGFLDSAFDLTAFNNYKAEVMEGINALQAAITNGTVATGDNIATLLDGTGKSWVESLNAMAMATGMSVDQMNALLNQLGVQAKVEVKDVQQKMKVPTYIEVQEPIPVSAQSTYFNGTSTQVINESRTMWRKYTIPGPSTEVNGTVQVAQISTEGNTSVGSPKVTYTGTSGGSVGGGVAPSSVPSKGGGGGGGSSSKPKATSDERKKKSEIVDPYKEVNDQIERANHLMSKNNTLAEGMWGAARSAKMRENINLLNQEVALLEDKLAISEQQMTISRGDLSSAAAVLGVQLDFDGNGLVSNIVDAQESIWQQREALLDSFGADIDEAEQARLDDFDEYIEDFTSAYDEYENHRQTQMDAEAEQLAKQLEAQQVMFDDLNQTLEENVSLIEKDLELVEYYLSKVEDDFYGMAEAAALMVGNLSSTNPGEGGQLGAYLATLEAQEQYKKELDEAYANGDINQAQYIEGLMNCQSATIEALQSLNELDKTMKGYYGETLEAAQEELSQYTDMMEHHSEVLEHYSSLLELIGASKDWERMKTVFEAQVNVAENAAAVSKANYEMLAQEAADKKAAWEALGKGLGDELTYEESVIKQQWLDAQAAADEAQNQMLEDAEAWAESLKSLLETELAELADILNESLSGEFGSLDNMMTAMERANSLQEEYLTTTNQVYETNKLMHTAQQEIDKTTNSVAKRRLKQYIDETEQLQNKNKLSQFELNIQKAKYDLLVAEIALQEAQQAKSTVRLQRDSEGNFGYVYTADQNAVAEAEQQLADAQNALYNIGLEGANKYAESYAQTIQEMNDAVTELTEQWQNGEIDSKEEYQQRMLELEEYYGEKLMQYSELHSVALQTDSRVAADAWTRDFAYMTTQTQKWMQNVDVYVQGVEASMDRYQQGINRVEEYAGLDLDSLKTKTQNIKDENKALAKSITEKDGLLDAMKDEITEVGNLTREYAKLRTEIQGTVNDYEDLLRRMGVDIDTAAAGNPPFGGGDTGDSDTSENNPGTTNPGTTNSGTTDPGDTGTKTISVGGKVNASGAQIYDYAGDTSGEHQYFSSDPVYKVLKESGDWIQVRHHKLSSGITGWFKKSDVTAMNTGGYTGDWAGSYGKLAFLHQKELVLNAKDTENLLASMDILDKIISTIDLYSSSAQLGGMLSSPRYGGFDSEPLEQNVHIEASFPSVTDHNEIEDALNNLINRASQYAYRK